MNRRLWVLGATIWLGACGGTADEDGGSLTAALGPAGGALEGARGTIFEKVRLDVPAGALQGDVDIRITPTFDDTPLAETARGCGLQFRIEPEGLALARPATLRLPVDPVAVSRHGQDHDAVAVWVRAGEGWAQEPAVATAPGEVTVEIATLATAGAGVKALSKPPTCTGTGCQVAHRDDCFSSTGFCLESWPKPVTGHSDFDVRGDFIYSAHNVKGGAVRTYRVDRRSGAIETGPVLQNPLQERTAVRRVTVDADGAIWYGLHLHGNARIRWGAALVEVFDSEGVRDPRFVPGKGTLLTARGDLVRLWAAGYLVRRNGTDRPKVVALTAAEGYEFAAMGDGFVAQDLTGRIVAVEVPTPGALTDGVEDTKMPRLAVFAVARDGTLAWQSPDGSIYRLAPRTPVPVLASLLPRLADVAFDADGGLWLASAEAAQVFHLSAAGVLTSTLLTDAEPGTLEHLRDVPLRARAAEDGSLMVQTIGNFHHLRRGPR